MGPWGWYPPSQACLSLQLLPQWRRRPPALISSEVVENASFGCGTLLTWGSGSSAATADASFLVRFDERGWVLSPAALVVALAGERARFLDILAFGGMSVT